MENILALTREVALNELTPRAEEVDREGKWPRASICALQKSGLAGLVVPSHLGGQGFGLSGVAKVCEILGKACPSTAMCFGMHLVGSAVVSAKATPEQEEKFLIPIAKGEHLTTLSLSEPGTGVNLYIPEAELKPNESGGYILNGKKSFVTNGGHADSYVVSTVTPNPDSPLGQFSAVMVNNDADGVEWQHQWEGMGMRGNSSRDVELKDVHIPQSHLLGEEGDQIWYIFEVVVPYFITAMAGTYLGIATAAVEEVVEHLKSRKHSHSGTSLAHQPVVQHRLGQLWAKVERIRQLLYSAATKGDANTSESTLSLFAAKAEVGDTAVEVVNEVMTLMGGTAYGKNAKVARLLRDVRAVQVMAPTTDQLRTWTGRALLDVPLLGD